MRIALGSNAASPRSMNSMTVERTTPRNNSSLFAK